MAPRERGGPGTELLGQAQWPGGVQRSPEPVGTDRGHLPGNCPAQDPIAVMRAAMPGNIAPALSSG